jgi:hypothetical protein
MYEINQWVNWEFVTDHKGRKTKVPVNAFNGCKINPHNADNHLTYDQACMRSSKIGFVITEHDPYFIIDIDHCLIDGQWSELAIELSNKFAECYQEVSISGSALHIIGSVDDLTHDHTCRNKLQIELYTQKRFVAITGQSATGNPDEIVNAEYHAIVNQYFSRRGVNHSDGGLWTTSPVMGWHGPTDDAELIKKMLNSGKSSASVFNDSRASFSDLWVRNVEKLAVAYPHADADFDASSADQALLMHLAFWTGKDCDRMERLFSVSGLVRDKWVTREDYRRRSIINACAMTNKVYGQGVSITDAQTVGHVIQQQVMLGDLTPIPRSPGFQLMTPDTQIQYFSGCVYISHDNKIMIPNRRLLNKQQFDAFYGGWVFSLDAENNKTVKSAWDALTLSQAVNFPKVDGRQFDPLNKTGLIIEHDGTTHINTYTPANVPSVPGDISRFLRHLEGMLPVQQDREILLAWCAAVVQYPGHKFGWAPLVQGTYGNGKSMIGECIAEAVGRNYSHEPNAKQITEKYNTWLLDTVFQCIDEMYVGNDKYTTMEQFKSWIQHKGRVEIRGMNQDKVMRKICCNFLLLTNHKDAIVKTKEDRRFAPFFCAQQTLEDMEKIGWLGGYFPDLFAWLHGNGRYQGQVPGFHHVTHFLQTYQIPQDLNPATELGGLCHRAPTTSSTMEAIQESLGMGEQLIQAAIDDEKQGFRGGFVSSVQVQNLLRFNNFKTSPKRIKEMMNNLNYRLHPNLSEGKVSSRNNFDKGRPKLYVNTDTIRVTSGMRPKEITEIYLKEQGYNMENVFGK